MTATMKSAARTKAARSKATDVSESPEAHEPYAIRREVEQLAKRLNAFIDSVPRGSAFDKFWRRNTASGRRDLEFLGTALDVTVAAMDCDDFVPPSNRIAAHKADVGEVKDDKTRERLPARFDERDPNGTHRAEAVA